MVDALISAMNHSASLHSSVDDAAAVTKFTATLRNAIYATYRYGQGTRDMAGPDGLTTEGFINKVAWRLGRYVAAASEDMPVKDTLIPSLKFRRNYNVDREALRDLFNQYDKDKSGTITIDELETMLASIGVAPKANTALDAKSKKDEEVQ
jgi:isocitrate dehydrogenase